MIDEQQYVWKYSEKDPGAIAAEFEYNGEVYAVLHANDWFQVSRKSEIIPYEETNQYKQEQYRKAEQERFKAAEDEIVQHVQKKAIKQLEGRIRMNVAFSKGGAADHISLQIAEELRKMIEKFDTYDLKQEIPSASTDKQSVLDKTAAEA
jgi:L-cysteine desulfidase